MTEYYRPITQTDAKRPEGAVRLADGWVWFDQVEVLSRTAEPKVIAANSLDENVLERLTSPRTQINGLSMTKPQIMGILNVTPDSFSDGGQHNAAEDAVARARQMENDGATIIDIGGESTRPGAAFVEISEEVSRVVPPIEGIRAGSSVAISIDTRKAGVADAAIDAGASFINDVSALTHDPNLAAVAAKSTLPVCLMHAKGDPENMQDDPQYEDVLLDVYDYLSARIEYAVAKGVPREKIIVDPGIGFGKTLEHNLTLLRGISIFHGLGCPILLGASRKKFIGTLGNAPDAKDRVAGSVSVALNGVNQGVQILRVHDTFASKQAIDLQMAMIGTSGYDT